MQKVTFELEFLIIMHTVQNVSSYLKQLLNKNIVFELG